MLIHLLTRNWLPFTLVTVEIQKNGTLFAFQTSTDTAHVLQCPYFQVKLNYAEKNYIALSESCVQIDKRHMLEIRSKINFL